MMRTNQLGVIKALVLLLLFSVPGFSQQPISPLVQSFEVYSAMKKNTPYKLDWVSLGPTVNSARADVVQVDATHPGTMYVGFGSGGIWKTINNGLNWQSIFDEQPALGIGDFELAPSNPSVIYLGTGEHLKKPRNFTLPGTGMYKSEDGGKTWKHIGLEDSWSIAEIAIHPSNPNVVLVCVVGHLWSTNKNRGIFRTIDGGKTWQQVLKINEQTGANDVVIAPSNPNIVYASMWEVNPGVSGKNSGIYKSADAGKTWTPLKMGLPTGEKVGRIGVAVSHTNPNKAYALIDNLNNKRDETAELYKTEDGGAHWVKTHAKPFKLFPGIGWYFTDVYLNPKNDEEVYCLGVRLAHSADGGKTFDFVGGKVLHATKSQAQGLHLDQCELWINPKNPNHLALGNDGGFYVSYDKGLTWMHYNNIPTGEFYDLTIDPSTNLIYGGTQDDATVFGPAAEINTNFPDPWEYLWIDPWDGGDGCVTQVDPRDSHIVYYSMQHGAAQRVDRRVDSVVSIQPTLPVELKDTLRFNYITPYFISPHQHETLYHGGNFIFKSTDRGDSWKVISPNLSKSSDQQKQSFALGAIAESKIAQGLLYAGTDKGSFWVSKDDGKNWEENAQGLANNYIRSISPSRFSKERVYMTMTGLNYDDLHRYVYLSEDHGKNWENISEGLPDEPVNVILEDPKDENILYVGSIRGVFISLDRGKTWSYLGKNMPSAAIADLEINETTQDLVVATHGRGIYKVNLSPIYELRKLARPDLDQFLSIPQVQLPWKNSLGGEIDYRTLEKVPVSCWLAEPKQLTLSLTDQEGKQLWTYTFAGEKGLNQYRWDLIVQKVKSDYAYFIHYDKFLTEGTYRMNLTAKNLTLTQLLLAVKSTSPYTR
jgi:photosystem II stability/assembly factor-like uncharacterized protein